MNKKTIERLDKENQEEKERVEALMKLPLWWGYLHVNGSVQVKTFFDNRDLTEAHESPFVQAVCTPMPCKDRADALMKVGRKFGMEVDEYGRDKDVDRVQQGF